jgi:hypothetical protein
VNSRTKLPEKSRESYTGIDNHISKMSSRRLLSGANRSSGRPNTAAASSSRNSNNNTANNTPVELPEYEPPSCPLDPTARRALAELANNTDTRKYAEQLSQSLDILGKSVASLNDRLVERSSQLENQQGKRRDRAGDASEKEKGDLELTLEKAVASLRSSVPGVTERSEAAVREVIDWKVELQDGKAALEEAKRMVEEEGLRVASMSQRRAPRRRKREDDDEDDEDGGGEEVEQMDEDDDEPAEITGPLSFHDQARQKLIADYEAKSMYQRYGLSNDYIQFKKLWHDATHGADRKPLPNAKQWFDENDQEGGEDSDEDLIVAEEVIDLKCPLSLVMMKEPYTSKRCKHTFEKAAIFEFLHGRPQKCPQTGCNQVRRTVSFILP